MAQGALGRRRSRLTVLIAIPITAAALVAVAVSGGGGARAVQTQASGDPRGIVITAGGTRTAVDDVDLLNGVTFQVHQGTATGPLVGTCTTGSDGTGKCSVPVPTTNCFNTANSCTVVLTGAPSGWFINTHLGVGVTGSVTNQVYNTISGVVVTGDQEVAIPAPNPNSTSPTAAKSGIWALSRDDPPVPAVCGLKIALLFDLSASIGTDLHRYLEAGTDFVSALKGTPSQVAIYNFATNSPATPGNVNSPLHSVATQDDVDAVNAAIRRQVLPTPSNPHAFTNWDQGLWRIASSGVHYDDVIVLTDGDPTKYSDPALGLSTATTRFIEVENGIFSANALKAQHTAVEAVGVGITNTGSMNNLRAISGDGRFFTTGFGTLGADLAALAKENCTGTINVVKRIVDNSETTLSTATSSPGVGWTFTAMPAGEVTDHVRETNDTGVVSFTRTNPHEALTCRSPRRR